MENIILQLIKKYFTFLGNMDFNNMTTVFQTNIPKFGCELFASVLELMDDEIMKSPQRKRSWNVIKIDKRTIKTTFGEIIFCRRYYQNKHTKQYAYLLDQTIGIIPRQRLEVTLEAKIIEFANVLAFEKAGKMTSDYVSVSKQTVKNIVAKFAQKEADEYQDLKKKKEVKVLFIEADEDHVSLQKSNKNNTINKLIYVHDGKINETKTRKFLLNKHIFSSNLKSSEDLWIEVYDYIYSTYDVTKIEKIFILGDGANWIKTGLEWIENAEFVLDTFHLNKAILQISGGKTREENKKRYSNLKGSIYSKSKEEFNKYAKELVEGEKGKVANERKDRHRKYILNQWKGIESNLDNKEKYQLGCSAEGHVSHILASRMSSRPISWSKEGLEAITKLRVAIENGITRTGIEKTLLKVNKKMSQEKYKPVKHLKRIKRHAMEILGNVPVLSIGKVNGLQTMMGGLR